MSANLHVIVGLGVTGFSCARYLKEQGIPFAVVDTRENPPQLNLFQEAFPDVSLSLGKWDETVFKDAAYIILSPGVSVDEPLIAAQRKRGIPVIGDIELFVKNSHVPIIAITGTNAKSTVTTLVGKMMEAAGYRVQVGGNLGIPALDLIDKAHPPEVFVLELSSFQLETTYSLRAKVASVLNITPDHLDRHKTMAQYQLAKHRIYEQCQLAIYNRDDRLTYTDHVSNKLAFTMQLPAKDEFGLMEKAGNTYLAFGEQLLLAVNELPVIGKHYQANALAALAIGHGFGLPFEPMLDVLRQFKGLPHRCQLVRERDGVRWYNDSKGTNVGATQAAIEGLGSVIPGKLILIAGGLGKGADFSPLLPFIRKYVRHVVLMGTAAAELAALFASEVPYSMADSMEEAVQVAAQQALPKDSVLLSPACASYDMFKHFEHRGDVFTALVNKL